MLCPMVYVMLVGNAKVAESILCCQPMALVRLQEDERMMSCAGVEVRESRGAALVSQ